MARILVAEKIADSGLDRLKAAGHEVDIQLGLTPEELTDAIVGAHALIIRSATTATREIIEAGSDLVVIGRAGVGLDNVDTPAATEQGVMVCNAPTSNIVSAAEQTMAMILASARNTAQAHAALTDGRWERSQWVGVELQEKTLGIVGLGQIGKLVATRAAAFDMKLLAYDPFISAEGAESVGAELIATLEEMVQRCDFLTLHVAKTPETLGMINAELLAHANPELRIINVARGGIINEADLAEAVTNGVIAGAAIDVFENEPVTDSPLFSVPQIVVNPHLGASTREAQVRAGETIAEQVELALAGDFVPFAVNLAAKGASETTRPFLPLCEELGALFAGLGGHSDKLEVEFAGEIGRYENQLGTLAVIKGYLGALTDESVSFVNGFVLADGLGITVETSNVSVPHNYINSVTVRSADHALTGTLMGLEAQMRIVELDGHGVDLPPANHLTVVWNEDRPGMIGNIAGIMGAAGINIDNMNVGQTPNGPSLMVLQTSVAVPDEVADSIVDIPGISNVRRLR